MGVRACLQELEARERGPARRAHTIPPQLLLRLNHAPQPPPTARLHVKIHGPWIATDYLLWEFLLQKVRAGPAHKI